MDHRYRLCPDEAQEAVLLEHCAHARNAREPGRRAAVPVVAGPGQRAGVSGADAAAHRGPRRRAVAGAGVLIGPAAGPAGFRPGQAAFFDPPNPAGKPSYRSKRGTQGFVIRDVTARRLNRNHAEVFVPKCGYVRFRLSRDLPADPGMARVTCDRSGRWHVAFGGPQPAVGRQPTGAVTGIDRGVRTGSCWGLLATRSAQKAAASGAVVLYVDPRHSSQQCRRCGHIASSSRESQAVFRCVACGHEDHADANAAKNVLARGLACLAVPAQAPGLRGVRPRKTPVNPGAAGTTREAA